MRYAQRPGRVQYTFKSTLYCQLSRPSSRKCLGWSGSAGPYILARQPANRLSDRHTDHSREEGMADGIAMVRRRRRHQRGSGSPSLSRRAFVCLRLARLFSTANDVPRAPSFPSPCVVGSSYRACSALASKQVQRDHCSRRLSHVHGQFDTTKSKRDLRAFCASFVLSSLFLLFSSFLSLLGRTAWLPLALPFISFSPFSNPLRHSPPAPPACLGHVLSLPSGLVFSSTVAPSPPAPGSPSQ